MGQLKYAVSITDETVGVNTPIMISGTFRECFRKAADCGYDGVELQIKDPTTRDVTELKDLMQTYRLEVPAIPTGMEYFGNGLRLIPDDADVQRRVVDRLIPDCGCIAAPSPHTALRHPAPGTPW